MIEEKLTESPRDLVPESTKETSFMMEQRSAAAERSADGIRGINAAPGDFVVVRGQTYKMSKATPSSDVIPTDSSARHSPEIIAFKEALHSAESRVSKQTEDLKKQSSRIEHLEQFIVQHAEKLGGTQTLKDLGLHSVSLRESGGSNNMGSAGKPRLGLAARRRAESQKSGVYELNVNTTGSPSQDDTTTNDTPSISAHSELNDTATSLTGITKHGGEEDISPISAANNNSHDLITPVAADKGDFADDDRASFTGDGVDRARTSPPMIRRSHSDGYTSPATRRVSDENSEIDNNGISSTSSIARNLADSAKKEKKEARKQAEIVDMTSLGAGADPSPSRAPPKGLAARLSMGSQERRKLNERRRQNSSDSLKALEQSGESASSTPQNQKESARPPGSSGSDRSHLDVPGSRASSASSNTSTLKHTRASSPALIAPAFSWMQGGRDDEEAAPHLFVAHDNPQLGQTVATSLRAAASGGAGMGFMLESKDEGGILNVFITGTIKYSGPFEGIEGCTLEGDMARGSQCLVGVDMVGYCVNMKTVPTRPRGELIEVDLHPEGKGRSDRGKSSAAGVKAAEDAVIRVPLSTKAALRSLLKTCKSRVDLILDPYHTDHKWFPYWEGRRKMAPQFRSRGIGYLRLGDDMSNYGSAFLSLDAGATYLDDGESGAVASNSNASTPQNGTGSGGWQSFSRGSTGNSSRPTSNNDSLYSSAGRQIDSATATPSSRGSSRDTTEDMTPYTDGTHSNSSRGNSAGSGVGMPGGIALIHEFGVVMDQPSSPGEDTAREEELREIIARLRDPDTKWADRTQNLQRLAELGVSSAGAAETAALATEGRGSQAAAAAAAATAGVASGDKVVMDAIAVLRDTLMKQNNPHVLKSALRCLPAISHGVRHRASCAVAWKSLLLESIHILRTVAKVHEEARIALDYLHSGGEDDRKQPCMSLCQTCGYFEEIILGPRGKGSGGKGASNTCKVIQWLQSVGSAELHASVIALATLDTRHFRPSVYERVDIGLLFKKSKSTFQHREEATREAMVHLSCILITLDVLQVTADAHSFIALTDTLRTASEDAYEAIITKAVSPSCVSGLAEMKKQAKRMYAKAVTATVRQLQTSAQVLEAQLATRDSSSPAPGEQQPPPQHRSPPLSGSLSAKSASRLRARSDASSPGDRYFVSSRGSSRGAATPGSGTRGGAASGSGSGSGSARASPSVTPRAAASSSSGTTEEGAMTTSESEAPASAATQTTESDVNNSQIELSDKWFEVRMMLKVLPTTSSSWNNLVSVAKGCDGFVDDLTSAAHRVGVTRATLLRAVLPFDESTSSSDQAKVASPNAKAEGILSQLGPNEADALRDQAVGLRKAVRIKMADEADLRQAIAATDMLRSFCSKVDRLGAMTSKAPVEIIKTLEAAN